MKPDPQSYQLPFLPNITFGAYPGHFDRDRAVTRIRSFVKAGITFFIDVTRDDDGLEPYITLYSEVSPEGAEPPLHQRFPIRDQSVPDKPGDMIRILDALDDAVEQGHHVYLHCWGGIGRTGMVAGCYLVRHGLSGELALKEVSRIFKGTPLGKAGRQSPETYEQRRFVLEWAAHDPKAAWSGNAELEFRARRYARLLIAEAGGDLDAARKEANERANAASADGSQGTGQVWARVAEILTTD